MVRTEQSSSTRTTTTAQHLGWDLSFTQEINGAQKNCSCYGSIPGTSSSLSANISNGTGGPVPGPNSANVSVSFNGADFDAVLADDIVAELKLSIA